MADQIKSEASPSVAAPAVELIGIDKRFGAVHANRAVSLRIAVGSIHGIIGENGAGKSTLMSILYGYYQADAGEIRIAGKPVHIGNSHDALAHGIGMVHQHFMLVDPFTVLENVMLGVEGGYLLAAGAAQARAELQRLQRDYKLEVDLDTPVGELPVGLQQRVEILKALYRGAQVLILDEPTGVLTPQEADHLFRILRALRDEGKTVILITHKLREILEVTDRVTVMRQGAVVAERATRDTTKEELAELMVGRKVLLRVEKSPAKPGPVVLEVRGLTVIDGAGVRRVKDVSFDVRAGEIVGIAGVSGNGQSELLEALSGIRRASSGTVKIKGSECGVTHTIDPRAMRALGLAHVPEDRQRMGLVTAFAINESAILGYHDDKRYNGPLLMDRDKIIDLCGRQMGDYDVRPPDPRLRTAALSGGNQQKVVLAREFDRDPELLLVGQPTRGVDIGAIEFIHRRLIAMRDAGKAVLLVSVELDEILSLADRILVMFDGRVVGEVAPAQATEQKLGLMMAGASEAAA
ncbi:MAG: ABC transporter ATP-binding protein [Alphaproteobacteria bacterium]|nr:ABC transporter ATP-binding protein [Alphaproteobacteria bacterium]